MPNKLLRFHYLFLAYIFVLILVDILRDTFIKWNGLSVLASSWQLLWFVDVLYFICVEEIGEDEAKYAANDEADNINKGTVC